MLLARSRGAERLGPGEVERTLGHAHPVLGRVVRLLVDEATESELGWALDTVRALVEAGDFPTLEARAGADAWLYFYETFLARYDPRLRDQYGVYYRLPLSFRPRLRSSTRSYESASSARTGWPPKG